MDWYVLELLILIARWGNPKHFACNLLRALVGHSARRAKHFVCMHFSGGI
jgi:hypothetical protein